MYIKIKICYCFPSESKEVVAVPAHVSNTVMPRLLTLPQSCAFVDLNSDFTAGL